VARAAGLVFGIIVIPAVGQDVGHRQGAVAHHSGRHLSARGESLDHHGVRHIIRQLRRPVACVMHQIDANAGPFVIGLHDIRRRHHMSGAHISRVCDDAFHDRQTSCNKGVFGALFIQRKGRSQHPRVSIRNTQPFKQTLHAAVFAPAAMQSVKDDSRHFGSQTRRQISPSVKFHNRESFIPQGICTFTARRE
jgi:hypothetical protein